MPRISKKFLPDSKIPFLYILGFLFLFYILFILGRSVYQNYKINQEIKKLSLEISTLEIENQNLKNLISYFQTKSFKEKEARKKLGLVKPDEKVVIITETPPPLKAPKEIEKEEKIPNYKLWWKFLFEKR